MPHGIRTIGRKTDLQHMITDEPQLHGSGGSDHRIRIEHQDTVVIVPQSELILGADHALALLPPDLALLDDDAGPIVHAQVRTHGCDKDLLPFGDIGRAAYDLHRFPAAQIDHGHAEPVRIRMPATFQYMAHHHTTQHPLDGLMHGHAFAFQSGAGENGRCLLWREVGVDVSGEPVPGDAHRGAFQRGAKIPKPIGVYLREWWAWP
jgi:hypothetical protein